MYTKIERSVIHQIFTNIIDGTIDIMLYTFIYQFVYIVSFMMTFRVEYTINEIICKNTLNSFEIQLNVPSVNNTLSPIIRIKLNVFLY